MPVLPHVRSVISGHVQRKSRCPLSANSGHGVAPSEQMSFAIAAMASGRGPGEDSAEALVVSRSQNFVLSGCA